MNNEIELEIKYLLTDNRLEAKRFVLTDAEQEADFCGGKIVRLENIKTYTPWLVMLGNLYIHKNQE